MSPAQAIQEALGGTQREVAARLGITFQSWNRYLKGRSTPSAATVQAWCAAAGVALVCAGDGWHVQQLGCPMPSECHKTVYARTRADFPDKADEVREIRIDPRSPKEDEQ